MSAAAHDATMVGGSELEAVAAFLFHEAALLDEHRYEEWLELFADDGVYWIPCTRTGGDPEREVSIVYDDRSRLGERVKRLTSGDAFAQMPPSETCRFVTNLRVTEEGDVVSATANELVVEHRRGRQTVHAGSYRFDLIRDGGEWRIKAKVVRLVNAAEPQGNLSIVL